MSSLTAIDTSQYTSAFASAFEGVHAAGAQAYKQEQAPNNAAVEKDTPKVDLNSYYTNVQPPEIRADVKSQVAQASQNLDKAISAAVVNGGLNAQDAMNIQKAKTAYEATISSANTASNFELQVS